MILFYFAALIFVLVCGIAIGATVVRDWLDGLVWWRAPAPKREPLPRAWVASISDLNTPTIKRRQRMQVIDV